MQWQNARYETRVKLLNQCDNELKSQELTSENI